MNFLTKKMNIHLKQPTHSHKVRDSSKMVESLMEQTVLLLKVVHKAKMQTKVEDNKERGHRVKLVVRMVTQQQSPRPAARLLQHPQQETQSPSKFATRSSILKNLKEVRHLSLSKPRKTCSTHLCAITTR